MTLKFPKIFVSYKEVRIIQCVQDNDGIALGARLLEEIQQWLNWECFALHNEISEKYFTHK